MKIDTRVRRRSPAAPLSHHSLHHIRTTRTGGKGKPKVSQRSLFGPLTCIFAKRRCSRHSLKPD